MSGWNRKRISLISLAGRITTRSTSYLPVTPKLCWGFFREDGPSSYFSILLSSSRVPPYVSLGKRNIVWTFRLVFISLLTRTLVRLHWQRLPSEAACAAGPSTSHIRLLSSLRSQHFCCGGSLEQVHRYPQWGFRSSRTRSSRLRSLDVPWVALHVRSQ